MKENDISQKVSTTISSHDQASGIAPTDCGCVHYSLRNTARAFSLYYSPRLQSLPLHFAFTHLRLLNHNSLLLYFSCVFFANELYVYEIRQTKEPIRDHERLVSCLSPAPSRLACEHDNSPRQLGVNERKMLCVHSATQG